MSENPIKLITIDKAAKMLGVTPLTLRNWDNSGKFPASRHPINNYRVYKLSDVEKLIAEIEATKGQRPVRKTPRNQIKKVTVQHL